MPPTTAAADSLVNDPGRDRAESRAGDLGQWRLRMLEELAEIGMGIARAVRRQAEAQAEAAEIGVAAGTEPPRGAGQSELVYQRVARAVRQCLALHAKFEKETLERQQNAEAEEAARRAAPAQRAAAAKREHRAQRRKIVERAVRYAVEAELEVGDAVDTLEDLSERLDDYERDDDFMDRPVGEIVARLCRELRVTVDLSLWEEEPWAIAEMETKPPGSPYADTELDEDDPEDDDSEVRANGRGPP